MGLLSKLFKSDDAAKPAAPAKPAPVTVTGGVDSFAAPVDGKVIPLSEVPDAVFSGGMLGQGCGIEPTGSTVYAPISGTLTALAPTMHGIGITGDSDIEALVHVGVDTVKMGGDGFTAYVKQNDHVEAGQPIVSFDREKIAAAGHPDTVIVVVSNSAKLAEVTVCAEGTVSAGKPLIKVAR